MQLDDQQRAQLDAWVNEGADMGTIQKRFDSELGIKMTYLETRLLLGDLNLTLKEEKKDVAPTTIDPNNAPDESPVPGAEDTPGIGGGGGVSVSMDSVAQPDTLVSGKVTFSDGATSRWSLDQMGRLGLDSDVPGYRPSNEDLEAFQRELQRLMESEQL